MDSRVATFTSRRVRHALPLLVLAGCSASEPPDPSARTPTADLALEPLLARRGFDLSAIEVAESRRGDDTFYRLSMRGIPISGLGGKRHGDAAEPRFPRLRYAPIETPDLAPRLSDLEAFDAVAGLLPGGARLVSSALELEPRQVLQSRAAPRPGRPLVEADYDRVITGFTLVHRLVVAAPGAAGAGERRWIAVVDARTGAPLSIDPIASAVTYANVTGYGYYRGTKHMQLQLVAGTPNPYVFVDTMGNRYVDSTVGTPLQSPDNQFGDGQLLDPFPTPANIETAAVDGYDGVLLTWAMFDGVLNRLGPNVQALPATIAVNRQTDSAEWDPVSRTLVIGVRSLTPDPTTNKLHTMASTDVVAHELGHDFFDSDVYPNLAQLDPGNSEAAGLNEGTGDIVAFLTELYRDAIAQQQQPINLDAQTPASWNYTIGESTGSTPIRDMLFPEIPVWSFDFAESHSRWQNAGPIDRLFLLMAYGCKPPPPDPLHHYNPWTCDGVLHSNGLGPTTAAKIWACTVSQLTPGSTFDDANVDALACAAVNDGAFGGPQTRAVASAFAGIHVGHPPDVTPPTATLECHQIVGAVECSGTIVDDQDDAPPSDHPALLRIDAGPPVATLTSYTFTTMINIGLFSADIHSMTLTAWDRWGNQVSVSANVLVDKEPPVYWLGVSGPPKQPTIDVGATDISGIGRIEFWNGASLVKRCNPFANTAHCAATFNTSTWSDGSHVINIRVFDSVDNLAQTNYTIVADNTPPVVSLAATGENPPFSVGVNATDASTLTKADLKLDAALLDTRTGPSPYTFSYAPSSGGNHTLRAEVTDSYGNVGVASVNAPHDTQPPNVTFQASQWNAVVTLTFSVDDTCGVTIPYALFIDGQLAAQPTTAGYSLVLTTLADGVHSFQASVSDRCGNPLTFVMPFAKVTTPPVLTIEHRDNTDLKRNKFTLHCQDGDGVHHTELRKNGVIIDTQKGADPTFVIDTSSWQPDGEATVVFQCMDIYGVPSNAVNANLTVDNTGPTFAFAVAGAGHTYDVLAGNVGDLHGIKQVRLAGGLIFPAFDATLTVAPYEYVWQIQTSIIIQTQIPFYVTATDTWGNETSKTYFCAMDTNTRMPAPLVCQAAP